MRSNNAKENDAINARVDALSLSSTLMTAVDKTMAHANEMRIAANEARYASQERLVYLPLADALVAAVEGNFEIAMRARREQYAEALEHNGACDAADRPHRIPYFRGLTCADVRAPSHAYLDTVDPAKESLVRAALEARELAGTQRDGAHSTGILSRARSRYMLPSVSWATDAVRATPHGYAAIIRYAPGTTARRTASSVALSTALLGAAAEGTYENEVPRGKQTSGGMSCTQSRGVAAVLGAADHVCTMTTDKLQRPRAS